MNIRSFLKPLFFIFAAVLLVSCDENANEIGANIVGNDNFKLVAACKHRLIELAARYDFTVALDRDPLALQPHVLQ